MADTDNQTFTKGKKTLNFAVTRSLKFLITWWQLFYKKAITKWILVVTVVPMSSMHDQLTGKWIVEDHVTFAHVTRLRSSSSFVKKSRLSSIQQWLGCFCFFSREVEFTFSYLKDVYSLLFYTFSLVDYLIAFHCANYATTRSNSYAEVGI